MSQRTTPKSILERVPRVVVLVLCFFLGVLLGLFVLPYGFGLWFGGRPALAGLLAVVLLLVVVALLVLRKPWAWAVLVGGGVGTVGMFALGVLFVSQMSRDEVFVQDPKTFGEFLGLSLPTTASTVQVQEGGFQDLLVLARFEMPKAVVANFLRRVLGGTQSTRNKRSCAYA